ncbi:MAG: hypothetical protein OJJ54_17720 [Pseudonocardia sp.]|nr:hypothetical protein [Pseudonocardia sp.]
MEDGFGFRAEKLLRLAEQEAADARSRANKDAAQILEQARADAETHRHDVEQTLIARASLHEQQVAQRTAELKDREEQAAEQLSAARAEAEELRNAAARGADELRAEAEARATEIRDRAEEAAGRSREQATQELRRLRGLHDGVRSELSRLREMLGHELGDFRAERPVPGQRPRHGSAGQGERSEPKGDEDGGDRSVNGSPRPGALRSGT